MLLSVIFSFLNLFHVLKFYIVPLLIFRCYLSILGFIGGIIRIRLLMLIHLILHLPELGAHDLCGPVNGYYKFENELIK